MLKHATPNGATLALDLSAAASPSAFSPAREMVGARGRAPKPMRFPPPGSGARMAGADSLAELNRLAASLPRARRRRMLAALSGADGLEAEAALHVWPLWARDSQMPPSGDWAVWLLMAGRGFGKTRTGAEWVRARVESGSARRVALVARTPADARDVMIEGDSGLLSVCPAWNRPKYEPTKRRLTWPNGAFALTFSSHEPNQLRGPQFDAAWCDELASWEYPRETWDNLTFGLRLGDRPQCVVTTTPRPIDLLRELIARDDVRVTRGSTYENKPFLAASFLQQIERRYEGTDTGRQEIFAELLDEDERALWRRAWIRRAESPPDLARVVVAVDPAMSSRPSSAETGIVVAGADERGNGYVLADASGRLSPDGWARRAISLFERHAADRIIGERNNGGDLVGATLKTAAKGKALPIRLVTASRGKFARAEPIAALYQQGRVHHVGAFPKLEDQLCSWQPASPASPDRMDALVWALTDLIADRRELRIWV